MRRFYPLPADEPSLWPHADEISNTRGVYHLGRRILDGGLAVTWGGNPRYWRQIGDPTSPRGRVWCLETVCWLAVNGKVHAPRPGLYAAFFRVRQAVREDPLLQFSAEWKVSAKHPAKVGFLRRNERSRTRPALSRQESETEASWTHWRSYDEENPGGWLLCHVGNIVVGDPSGDTQRRRGGGGGGGGGADEEGGGREDDEKTLEVLVSFGGENAWCKNLVVDFAALAPIRMSWDVERVLMIGHRKGHSRISVASGAGSRQHDEEGRLNENSDPARPPGATAAATGSAAQGNGGASPLSRLPRGVLLLVLEFSQPTLVRPRVANEQPGEGDRSEAKQDGRGRRPEVGALKVF
ncbi:unnamed protein product [Scytosiphon promiscuus]